MSNTKSNNIEVIQDDNSEQQNEKGKEINSTESLQPSASDHEELKNSSGAKSKNQLITSPHKLIENSTSQLKVTKFNTKKSSKTSLMDTSFNKQQQKKQKEQIQLKSNVGSKRTHHQKKRLLSEDDKDEEPQIISEEHHNKRFKKDDHVSVKINSPQQQKTLSTQKTLNQPTSVTIPQNQCPLCANIFDYEEYVPRVLPCCSQAICSICIANCGTDKSIRCPFCKKDNNCSWEDTAINYELIGLPQQNDDKSVAKEQTEEEKLKEFIEQMNFQRFQPLQVYLINKNTFFFQTANITAEELLKMNYSRFNSSLQKTISILKSQGQNQHQLLQYDPPFKSAEEFKYFKELLSDYLEMIKTYPILKGQLKPIPFVENFQDKQATNNSIDKQDQEMMNQYFQEDFGMINQLADQKINQSNSFIYQDAISGQSIQLNEVDPTAVSILHQFNDKEDNKKTRQDNFIEKHFIKRSKPVNAEIPPSNDEVAIIGYTYFNPKQQEKTKRPAISLHQSYGLILLNKKDMQTNYYLMPTVVPCNKIELTFPAYSQKTQQMIAKFHVENFKMIKDTYIYNEGLRMKSRHMKDQSRVENAFSQVASSIYGDNQDEENLEQKANQQMKEPRSKSPQILQRPHSDLGLPKLPQQVIQKQQPFKRPLTPTTDTNYLIRNDISKIREFFHLVWNDLKKLDKPERYTGLNGYQIAYNDFKTMYEFNRLSEWFDQFDIRCDNDMYVGLSQTVAGLRLNEKITFQQYIIAKILKDIINIRQYLKDDWFNNQLFINQLTNEGYEYLQKIKIKISKGKAPYEFSSDMTQESPSKKDVGIAPQNLHTNNQQQYRQQQLIIGNQQANNSNLQINQQVHRQQNIYQESHQIPHQNKVIPQNNSKVDEDFAAYINDCIRDGILRRVSSKDWAGWMSYRDGRGYPEKITDPYQWVWLRNYNKKRVSQCKHELPESFVKTLFLQLQEPDELPNLELINNVLALQKRK